MTKRTHFRLIVILGSLAALGPFSIDMYLPGFAAIGKDLHSSTAEITLTLSSFFIGISAGQLLYGPLLDRYGRKKPLYIGLLFYLVASLGCAMALSINALIILRFIQALGSCAAAVAATTLVRDLFPVRDNAKVFSLLMLVIGVSPMIAPTLGGYVTDAYGWQSVFLILAFLSAGILIAVIFGLPEGQQPDLSLSLRPGPILGEFFTVLKTRLFYTYAFIGSISLGGLLTYVSGSPQVFMEVFHVNGKEYGWIFAFLSIGLISASQINSLMLKKYQSKHLITVALICQSVTGIILLAGTINSWLGLGGTIFLIFIFLACVGFILPNTSALAMMPFSKNAGSASSLMGALQMGLGTLASISLSLINDRSAVPMTAIMMGSAVIALLFSVLTGSTQKHTGREEGLQHSRAI